MLLDCDQVGERVEIQHHCAVLVCYVSRELLLDSSVIVNPEGFVVEQRLGRQRCGFIGKL